MAADKPKVEDVASSDNEETQQDGSAPCQNRNEKKARKAIQKMGLKHMPDIHRVAIKRHKHVLFIVEKPDVYKVPTSDTFVVFGEAKVEDLSMHNQQAQAQAFAQPGAGVGAAGAAGGSAVAASAASAADDDDDDEVVDATGIEEKDIDLVKTQTNCSRNKAIKALKKTNNDVVEAIMALS